MAFAMMTLTLLNVVMMEETVAARASTQTTVQIVNVEVELMDLDSQMLCLEMDFVMMRQILRHVCLMVAIVVDMIIPTMAMSMMTITLILIYLNAQNVHVMVRKVILFNPPKEIEIHCDFSFIIAIEILFCQLLKRTEGELESRLTGKSNILATSYILTKYLFISRLIDFFIHQPL